MKHYFSIEELLGMIYFEPARKACFQILSDNEKLFQTVQGSTNNHQAWIGGYWDHVQEVMNIAYNLLEVGRESWIQWAKNNGYYK